MPSAIPAVVGGALGLIGANKAAKSADADRAQSQAVVDRLARVQFNPQNINSPGGIGFNFRNNTSSLGQFQPFSNQFTNFAGLNLGQGTGLQQGALALNSPQFLNTLGQTQALQNASFGGIGGVNTDFLQSLFSGGAGFANSLLGNATAEGAGIRGTAGNVLGSAGMLGEEAGLLRNLGLGMIGSGDATRAAGLNFGQGGAGAALGLADSLQGRGDFFANEAQQGFDSLRQQTLDTLRARDRDGEDRAAAGLADQLFGSGRLGARQGSASGQLEQRDISDFAKGLARADLDRQLAATGEARAQQMQSGQLANMFSGLGLNARSQAPSFFNAGTNLFSQGVNLDNRGLNLLGQGTALQGAGTSLAGLAPSLINAGTNVSGLEQLPLNALSNFGQGFGRAQELENTLLNGAFDRFGLTSGMANDLIGNQFNLGTTLLGQGGGFLQSALGLESAPLDFAKFAAQLAERKAQTDIAAAGGQSTAIAGFGPTGSDLLAKGLTGLGSNLFESAGGFQTIGGALKDIFGSKDPTSSGSGGSGQGI